MAPSVPTVDVVIVNWNAETHLRACLDSLARASTSRFAFDKVVVVDNASTDSSLASLDGLALPVTVVANDENIGFGPACNQGAAIGSAPLLLFLNPDAVVYDDTLEETVAFLESAGGQDVAAVGGRLFDEQGAVISSCSRFPTLGLALTKMLGLNVIAPGIFPAQALTPAETSRSQEVDQLIGAYMLLRRAAFEELDGFDERFFMYYEEVDLSRRLRQRGWASYYLHEARIVHAGRGSSDQVPARRLLYSWRSRSQYAHKHWPAWQAWVLDATTASVETVTRVLAAILRRRPGDTAHALWAWRQYLSYLAAGDRTPEPQGRVPPVGGR